MQSLILLTMTHCHWMHWCWHSVVHMVPRAWMWVWLILLLKFHQELFIVFYLVMDVFLSFGVLFATERRRVFQVDSAVLTEEVRH